MSLPFHPKGTHTTRAGHLRYHSPVKLRGKYVHRHVIDQCIAASSFYVQSLLPWPYEVHHMDYNKTHNCPGNLLICSDSFHAAMTAHGQRRNATFNPKWQPPPDWVLFDHPDDEVPF